MEENIKFVCIQVRWLNLVPFATLCVCMCVCVWREVGKCKILSFSILLDTFKHNIL